MNTNYSTAERLAATRRQAASAAAFRGNGQPSKREQRITELFEGLASLDRAERLGQTYEKKRRERLQLRINELRQNLTGQLRRLGYAI